MQRQLSGVAGALFRALEKRNQFIHPPGECQSLFRGEGCLDCVCR